MGKTKDVRDQHRRHGDIKDKLWLPMVSTVEVQGDRHTHAHRKLRSGELSRDMFLGIPSSQRTLSVALLVALLTLVVRYVLAFTRSLSRFLFDKFCPTSHSCFYKTQGNEQMLWSWRFLYSKAF